MEPARPSTVPEEATWNPAEKEWETGPKDPEGRYHGSVRYWRPDGSLVSRADFVHGTVHGKAERYHESGEVSQACVYVDGVLHGTRVWIASDKPTTEKMHAAGYSLKIRRMEVDYDKGTIVALRYFDADGMPLDRAGNRLRTRPENVPAGALFDPKEKHWVLGVWDEKGGRNGFQKAWDKDGHLWADGDFRDDKAYGPHRSYFPDGRLRSEVHYEASKRHGRARQWRPDGALAREAEYRDGRMRGLQDFAEDGAVLRAIEFQDGERKVLKAFEGQGLPPQAARRSAPRKLRGRDFAAREPKDGDCRPPRTPKALAWAHKRIEAAVKDEAERRVRFALLTGNLDEAASGATGAVLRALNDDDRAARLNARLVFRRRFSNPWLGERCAVKIAGRFLRFDAHQRRGFLARAGLTEASGDRRPAFYLLGEKPGKAVEEALADPGRVLFEEDLPGAVQASPPTPRELSELLAAGRWEPDRKRRLKSWRHFERAAPLALLADVSALNLPDLNDSWHERTVDRFLYLAGALHGLDRDALWKAAFRLTGVGLAGILRSGGEEARAAAQAKVQDHALDLSLMTVPEIKPYIGRLEDVSKIEFDMMEIESLPDELADLWDLMSLSLSYNRLMDLPESLALLPHLTKLSIANNDLGVLPRALFGMHSLKSLSVNGNSLGVLPEEIGSLQRLEALWAGGNELTDLPRALARLPELTFLHLTGNPFKELPEVLWEMTQLKTLWLEWTELTELSPKIAALKDLKELCLWGNKLTRLPEELKTLKNLRELRIKGNPFPAGTVEEIQRALPACVIY